MPVSCLITWQRRQFCRRQAGLLSRAEAVLKVWSLTAIDLCKLAAAGPVSGFAGWAAFQACNKSCHLYFIGSCFRMSSRLEMAYRPMSSVTSSTSVVVLPTALIAEKTCDDQTIRLMLMLSSALTQ